MNLMLEQIARIERTSQLRQVSQLIAWLNGLGEAWRSLMASNKTIPLEEREFVTRFSRMSECLTAVLEQWCSLSSSSTEASKSVGLDRLRKLADTVEAPDDEARASIPRALLARLEQGEQDSLELSSADVLDVFAFLCQQFWSPLLDFTTSLLTSSD